MLKIPYALVLSLMLVNPARPEVGETQTNVPAITNALQSMQSTQSHQFIRTSHRNEQVMVESFTPPGQWVLSSIDGQAPSEKQRAEYQKKEANRARRKSPAGSFIHELAVMDSFQLISKDDATEIYEFKVKPDEEEPEFAQNMKGYLSLDKAQRIQLVEIKNTGPFSPAFSVKIKKILMSFKFTHDQALNRSFLTEINQETQGKAFGLKRIDEHQRITFSQFKPVGQ